MKSTMFAPRKENPWSRRRFLRGLGGATVGLPLLDAFARGRPATAAERPFVPCAFVVNSCGVVQDKGDMFWPSKQGPVTKASLLADKDRATGELADHADRLLFVKGINFKFKGVAGCGHAEGGAQVLTAARPSAGGRRSRAQGESVDCRIAREVNPAGKESLLLYAGRKGTWIDDFVSYRGPGQLRSGENSPWNAYRDLMGLQGNTSTPEAGAAAAEIARRRASVNDLVRTELKQLLARPDLSKEDRARLDLHFTNVRDMEVGITTKLPALDGKSFEAMDGAHTQDQNIVTVARLQMELCAYALASGINRVAVVQVGAGADRIRYPIDGKTNWPSLHQISHRIYSDGASGPEIPNARLLHHKIDRLHAGDFKHLLDKLAAYTTPEGNLLDLGFFVWTNELANGPSHGRDGVPYVIAGRARGYLKTGQFLDVGGQLNNKLLNALINAAGVRKKDSSPVDDFGDASLPRGVLTNVLA